MAFIGTPLDTRNTFQSLQGKRFNGDGSTTAFTLDVAPSSTLDIEVFVGNVRQDPNSGYTLSGTTLTFTGAPPSGTNNIYVVHQAKAVGTINPGANSVGVTELNLSDGSNGQAITTNGSGTLSFSTVSADADNYFATSGLSSKDLGVGLHIKTADSSASVDGNADELVIEGSGQSGITICSGASDKGNIFFADSGGTAQGKVIYNHSSNHLRFDTDGGQRLIMDSGGNFFFNCSATPSASVKGIAIEGDNELSISTNSTSADTIVRFFNNNGQVGKIETSGSSTSYDTSSDYRLKENVDYTFDATTRLKQLKPARFNFIADADTTLDGFIAHEVTPIVPEAISGEKDAVDSEGNIDPQGIDQSKLVPLLTKALQEAITKIETLEAKVKALEEA